MGASDEETAVCYTDNGGRPCGEAAVALLGIVPIGGGSLDRRATVPAGRIPICMHHLVILMYSNGVGPRELADTITTLSWQIARKIADDERPPPPPVPPPPPAGRARPILSATDEPRGPK